MSEELNAYPPKKKICFVVSAILTAEAFLCDHIEGLSDDYDVYLVGKFTSNELAVLNEFKLSGYHSVEIYRNISLYKDFKSVLELKKYLKRENFFAVHSVTPKAGLISALASILAHVPNRIHIFTGQVWYTKTGIQKPFLMLIDKVIAKLNTHILVDGESQRQFLIENRILRTSNSYVLGKGSISGVNIVRFQPKPEMRVNLRKDLNLAGKVVFGFLGRLNRDKGIQELYTAFDKLAKNNLNVHLLFIGRDEENMLSLLPNYANIHDGINFTNLGVTKKPEDILQMMDVFCLPSYREGFGTSVLEASCLGIPVICSDTYGLMDAMVDDVTGLRHKVGKSEDLYDNMKILANNKTIREEMGKNARKFVIENFSGETITNEWVKFYNSLKYGSSH